MKAYFVFPASQAGVFLIFRSGGKWPAPAKPYKRLKAPGLPQPAFQGNRGRNARLSDSPGKSQGSEPRAFPVPAQSPLRPKAGPGSAYSALPF